MQFRIASVFLLAVVLLAGLHQAAGQRDAELEKQLQAAIHKELVDGDLKAAIEMYQKIVARPGGNRTAAATALLHIGQCQEKLGNAEARQAYEQLLCDYPDQRELVAEAQARLSALRRPSAVATRQIWAGPEANGSGGVSPDGRLLTYVDWNSGGNLAVRDLTSGVNRLLTNNKGPQADSSQFAVRSVVSPDGKQVAYTWSREQDHYDLRLIGMDGSGARVLYRHKQDSYIEPAAWSPDGKHILATVSKQIVLVSAADGSVRVLKSGSGWPGKNPFSPDGRYILYDRRSTQDSPQRDIFLLAMPSGPEDGREIPLIQHPANDEVLGWAPDGRRILFASDRSGTRDAWLIEVRGEKVHGTPLLVKSHLPRMNPIGFTRNGSYYYGTGTASTELYLATLDPAARKFLNPPAPAIQRFVLPYTEPAFSPDGRYLAYLLHGGSSSDRFIAIRSLETGKDRELPKNFRRLFPQLSWFPDGLSLLVAGAHQSNYGIYKVDVQSGNVTVLVDAGPNVFLATPQSSPDGKVIFYKRNIWKRAGPSETPQYTTLRRELETGQEKVLLEAWNNSMAVSPDGRQLAVATDKELKLIPAAGGEPRGLLTVAAPESLSSVAWRPDGRQLLFLRGSAQPFDLWRISAEGGQPQRIGPLPEGTLGLRVHPDGQRLAFTAGEPGKSEVWVLENFLPELKGIR
jgi:Tol biopolymer transport system component